jgi:hypothetical protein
VTAAFDCAVAELDPVVGTAKACRYLLAPEELELRHVWVSVLKLGGSDLSVIGSRVFR